MAEAEKDIPILFYGWVVPGTRRAAMLAELQAAHGVAITLSNMQAYKCEKFYISFKVLGFRAPHIQLSLPSGGKD